WLAALDRIGALDVEVIVPGHGEPCDKRYLKTQAEIIRNWLGLVEDFIQRGLTEQDALKEPIEATSLDPYPIGQRLFEMSLHLNGMNVSNLYKRVEARHAEAAEMPVGGKT
ncbi:MAG: hypothetical protein KGJ86_19955, partial [Chloroflexota bacterium]|nr:hypothetical protein [Chloroflexota bacterium]